MFVGVHERQLDDKGRLALQAELRQLDGRRRVVLAALAELTALAPAAA